MATEQQALFADHLIAWLRSLSPSHPIGLTAGTILARLEKVPDCPQRTGAEVVKDAGGVKYIALPLSQADSPYSQSRLPHGEPRRRIEAFLSGGSHSAIDIANGTGVAYHTVMNVLYRGGFERDPNDRRLWRLVPEMTVVAEAS